MTNVDAAGSTRLQQITVTAIARAAGRGLFTAAEAGVLIDRIRAKAAAPLSATQDSQSSGLGEHSDGHAPGDPDGTVR
jgi:hypothetical protein